MNATSDNISLGLAGEVKAGGVSREESGCQAAVFLVIQSKSSAFLVFCPNFYDRDILFLVYMFSFLFCIIIRAYVWYTSVLL